MKGLKILIIDDEHLIRWSLKKQLSKHGCQVFVAETGEEGLKLFEKHDPDIVFLDNRLPGMSGLETLKKMKNINSQSLIVFMTAYGTIETAVQAMKSGAIEYVNKPFSFDEIDIILKNLKNQIQLDREIQLFRRQQAQEFSFEQFIGSSREIQNILKMAREIAQSQASTVLLLGESGTGKDLLAKIIHGESSRKDKPFVVINCSTLTETLLESELFGHEKGAFTDAKQQKKGLFEIADGGTVFLDEIGDIMPSTQVKLLQFIENKTFRRVGGTNEITVDVRIIAATNKNLKEAVLKGDFREDLYYRLKVFQITLPPLRERVEDIPLLAQHFVNLFNRQFHKDIQGITDEAVEILQQYSWPGNVRELRNVIERMVILEKGNYINVNSIPVELKKNISGINENIQRHIRPLVNNQFSLDDIEKHIIIQALEQAQFNKSRAAKLLNITRDTLRYKIKKYKIWKTG